jgi:hypothetical protein
MLMMSAKGRKAFLTENNGESVKFQMLSLRKNPATKPRSKTCTVCAHSA